MVDITGLVVDITGLVDSSLHSLNATFTPFTISYSKGVNNFLGTIIEKGLLQD